MTTNPLRAALAALILAAPASAATALPPLENNARIMGELVAGEVGYQIQKHCPTIGARKVRALFKLNELANYARSLGYTDENFNALSKDGDARAKRDALVEAYLEENGVVKGDPESYCRLGREEIEKNSLTGSLLSAK